MAVIETNNYKPDEVPGIYEHSLEELAQFGHDVREMLADPRIGFLKPEVVNGSDVTITEEFQARKASSAYAWVVVISASGSNPDFTDKWREFHFTPRTDKGEDIYKQDVQALKDLKLATDEIAQEKLRPKWFSQLTGADLGLNIWFVRRDGAFVVVHNK